MADGLTKTLTVRAGSRTVDLNTASGETGK